MEGGRRRMAEKPLQPVAVSRRALAHKQQQQQQPLPAEAKKHGPLAVYGGAVGARHSPIKK